MNTETQSRYWSNPEAHRASSTKYRLKNPEKAKAAVDRWYAKHREELNERRRIAYRKNRDAVLSAQRDQHREHPERRMFIAARMRARERGLSFNIELSDIVVPEFCPILGVRLDVGGCARNRHGDASPSLDRIVPERGYVKGNVAVISWRANRIKSDATVDEVEALLRYMKGGK